MASVGVVRKLFLDSRFKVSGTDADFQIELPADIDCTRTSSFFVASCSFANTYQTVTPFNNLLYYIVINTQGLPGIPPCQLWVAQVPTGVYTPETLAPALQTALGSQATVTWNPALGTYSFKWVQQGVLPTNYQIPSYLDLDSWFQYWKCDVMAPAGVTYTPGPSKQQSINGLLNLPVTYPKGPASYAGSTSGIVDLAPMREVYLHSSLANNRTLHINGSKDWIARIPIDVDYGEVVQYRYLGPTDALSSSDCHFRTIRFQLRDWAGNLAPTGSFVVIEICFLDTDPYAM